MKKGVKCFEDGKYSDAIGWLGEAVDAMPEKAGAGLYFIRCEAQSKMGNHKLAIQDLSKAIATEPDKSFFYENRGISYFEIGDYASSIEEFTNCIELASDSAMVITIEVLPILNSRITARRKRTLKKL